MWYILGGSCGAFLESFFLSGGFLKAYFKGGHLIILIGFKVENPTNSKYKLQNHILLGPKYKAQINYTLLYTIFISKGLVTLKLKNL